MFLGNLLIKITANSSGLNNGLLGASNSLQGLNNNVSSLSASMIGLGMSIHPAVAALLGLTEAFRDSINKAADMESQLLALEVMFQGRFKAQNLYKDLVKFAAQTPLKTDELLGATRVLAAYGVEAEQILPTIRMLGDLTVASGANLTETAGLYGKIMSTGKLNAREVWQFATHGINILAALEKQTGTNLQLLRSYIKESKVSYEDTAKSLKRLADEGGPFFQMMERQSQTINGLWSTLTDNLQIMWTEWGATLIEEFGLHDLLKRAIVMANELKNELVRIWPVIKQFATFQGMLLGFGWDMLVGYFYSLKSIITALLPSVSTLAKWMSSFNKDVKEGFDYIDVKNSIIDGMEMLSIKIVTVGQSITNIGLDFIRNFIRPAMSGVNNLVQIFLTGFRSMIRVIYIFKFAWEELTTLIIKFANFVINSLVVPIMDGIQSLVDMVLRLSRIMAMIPGPNQFMFVPITKAAEEYSNLLKDVRKDVDNLSLRSQKALNLRLDSDPTKDMENKLADTLLTIENMKRSLNEAAQLIDESIAKAPINVNWLDSIAEIKNQFDLTRAYLEKPLPALEFMKTDELKIKDMIPYEILEFAEKLGRESTSPIDKFNEDMAKLDYILLHNLATWEDYAKGVANVYETLEKAMKLDTKLPAAAVLGSSEAVSAVNKFMMDSEANNTQADIANTLKMGNDQRAEIIKQNNQIVEALRGDKIRENVSRAFIGIP